MNAAQYNWPQTMITDCSSAARVAKQKHLKVRVAHECAALCAVFITVLLPSLATAQQKSYSVTASWLYRSGVTGTEVDTNSCPSGTYTFTSGFAMTSSMWFETYFYFNPFPLNVNESGQWTPASRTFKAPPSLNYVSKETTIAAAATINPTQSTYNATLASSGILTIVETGGAIDYELNADYPQFAGTVQWSGQEVIDLNTGQDSWMFQAKVSGTYKVID
jgi:hypothetical protein